jgi:hypothetical protein
LKKIGSPDPSTVAFRLISNFEKISNQVLDTLELMGAVHAPHSRALDKGNHAVYGVKADELRQKIALNKP